MKNILKLSQILVLLFGISSEISYSNEEFSCEENLKWAENYVLNTITLYGKKNIENVVMGYYELDMPKGTCIHNIVVKYEVNKGPGPSTDWNSPDRIETIFRYFKINQRGYPLKPPVVMHARKPFERNGNPSNAKNEEYPPYKCEQRLEFEEDLARYYYPENSYELLSASTVFSRNTYPFCQYHIFFLKPRKNRENQEIEFSFDHVIRDESWYYNGSDGGPVVVGDRVGFKGRIIPYSELYPIH